MIPLYKYSGRKCCYDSTSGAVIELTALQYKMMGALESPLSPLCPTSLRYELAKFDSEDVTEAYNQLYALYRDGLLYGKGEPDTAQLRVSGEHAVTDAIEADLIFSYVKGEGMTKYRLSDDFADFAAIIASAEKNGLKS